MDITNFDAPDDGLIDDLAGLCQCYGAFLDRIDADDEVFGSVAEPRAFGE